MRADAARTGRLSRERANFQHEPGAVRQEEDQRRDRA